MPAPQPEIIDAVDLLCPLPVLKLRKALARMDAGAQVILHASDPAAVIDVPHFCAQSGDQLISMDTEGAVTSYTVVKAGEKPGG